MKNRLARFVVILFVLAVALGLAVSGTVQAAEKEPYAIEIYTYKVGSFTYAMGVALADFINKNSTRLKATAIEAVGASVTSRIVASEPAMRKKIIGFMVKYEPEAAYPPFKEPYYGIRNIAVIGFVSNGLVTLDPKIKTVHDLDGKRVGLGTSPSAARVEVPKAAILNAGVKNVKFSEHGMVDGVRALTDGMVDALLVGSFMVNTAPVKFGPNPAMSELMSTRKVYFVSFDKASYDKAAAALPRPNSWTNYSYVMPAGALKGLESPYVVQGGAIHWSCDKEMPDDVVYEIIRIMAENSGKFKDYHPLGRTITPENMAKMGSEDKVHAGALKYYREKGIKIRRF
jgi:TRAP transporter TAXI family solute receptor